MTFPERIVIFSLDDQRYGLSLAATERVVPAVEVTPLPGAPAVVFGVFNLHGRILPVLDVRRRFGVPERAVSVHDQFLIARAGTRTVALVVNATHGVVDLPASAMVAMSAVLPGVPNVRGVGRLPDGLVLVHDLEMFLGLDEAAALEHALRATAAEVGP